MFALLLSCVLHRFCLSYAKMNLMGPTKEEIWSPWIDIHIMGCWSRVIKWGWYKHYFLLKELIHLYKHCLEPGYQLWLEDHMHSWSPLYPLFVTQLMHWLRTHIWLVHFLNPLSYFVLNLIVSFNTNYLELAILIADYLACNLQRFLSTMRAVQGALIVASSIQIILGFSQIWAICSR